MSKKWLSSTGAFKEISAEAQVELEEKDLLEYKNAAVKDSAQKLKDAKEKTDANSEEIKELSKALSELKNGELKAILNAVHKQGEAIAANKLDVKGAEELADLIVKGFEEKRTDIKRLKENTGSVDIEIKADVTTGSVENSTFSARQQGIGKLPVRPTYMAGRFLNGGSLGVNSGGTITWVDQKSQTRGADNVAECGTFPESDIVWIERDLKAKKIGDSIPICEEALEDFNFIRSEVENFLIENIILKEDNDLLNGSGTGDIISGVAASAQAWSVAVGSPIEALANDIDTPTIANVAFTAISQIKNSGFNNTYMPNFIDLNPVDYQRMLLEKDVDKNSINDQLVRINDAGEVFIAGVRVVENPLVIQDEMWVGDYTKGTLFNHRGLRITLATQHGTDFLQDRVRLKGSIRKILMIRNVYANAFLKVPSIDAAIIALAK